MTRLQNISIVAIWSLMFKMEQIQRTAQIYIQLSHNPHMSTLLKLGFAFQLGVDTPPNNRLRPIVKFYL